MVRTMTEPPSPPLVLLCGPTAGGKSALALALAEALGGTIINADSMQVYRDLRILTARPTPGDEARVPHHLYGVLDGAEVCSAARWAGMAAEATREAWAKGRLPLMVGGTGLYLRALTEGLADIPAIPQDVRQAARARIQAEGAPAAHVALAARDPDTAARIDPGNAQRVARAWEVLEATGRPLAYWQDQPPARLLPEAHVMTLVLDPPREALRAAIDARFVHMVETGALDEVSHLLARALAPDAPVLKAVGVPELGAHSRGEIDLATAIERAQAASRRYAKRQRTWLRGQVRADLILAGRPLTPEESDEVIQKVRGITDAWRFQGTP